MAIPLSEHQIQSAYFYWVTLMRNQDWRYELIFAVPNGGKRHIITAKKMRKEGQKPGVLDVMIDIPTATSHGARIEFKSAKGQVTKEQRRMIELYRKAGFTTIVCRSFEFARAATEHYMSQAIV